MTLANLQSQPGTKDILPEEAGEWRFVEGTARSVCAQWGFREIRTPVFEATEVFERGVGGATDIVQKEMFTFETHERRITLRPEGTAPVVRAFLEHGMGSQAGQTKLYYLGPMFRYEKPQAGRQRQFHQLGVEVFGAAEPGADADVILLGLEFLKRIGITTTSLLLNSIGDATCRPGYLQKLRDYYRDRLPRLCEDCQRRYGRNVLRLLDCKQENCQREGEKAPRYVDSLCDACATHYEEVKRLLSGLGISFREESRLVRGLDYYNRTVFEVTSGALGAQDALFGGGRYDGLVETLGGPATPGVGWAAGIERALLVRKKIGLAAGKDDVQVYISPLGTTAEGKAFEIAGLFRAAGISTEVEYRRRSLKAQLRSANDLGARVSVILGDRELAEGVAAVKRMEGEGKGQETVPLGQLVEVVKKQLGGEQ